MIFFLFDLLANLCLKLLGKQSHPKWIILYYHNIDPHQIQAFQQQLNMVSRYTTPISINRDKHKGVLPIHGYFSSITFDDGFQSFAEIVVPELEKRQIPATVFIPTGYIGMEPGWIEQYGQHDQKPTLMSSDQIALLNNKPLITIGSHTVSHPRLDRLPLSSAQKELTDSRLYLEKLLARQVDAFSFPHGALNQELCKLAFAAGYKQIFSIDPVFGDLSSGTEPIGRVGVSPTDWPIEFLLKLFGAYRWNKLISKRKIRAFKNSL